MKNFKVYFLCVLVFSFVSCGGGGDSSDSLTSEQLVTAEQAVANALAGLFANSDSGSSLMVFQTSGSSCDSNDPGCTCETTRAGTTPLFIKATPFADAGDYGSNNDSVTLASEDFCNDSEGNENTGSGPGSDGLFAAFEVREDIEGSCSSTSISLDAGSSGVFLNDSSNNVTIYGEFDVTISGSTSTLNCTIEIASSGTVNSADCTDSSNNTIVSDTSQSCSMSVEQVQELLGNCDNYGLPEMTNSTQLDYVQDQMDDYIGTVTLMRPHRAGGHVFAYNIVDEDGDGTYDWDQPDDLVGEHQSRNMKIFANIYPETDDGEFDEEEEGYAVKITELPDDMNGYTDFVTAMVERYDGDGYEDMDGLELPIKHWAVANEPYCEESDTDCHEDILTLLEETYDAIKAADPDAVVFMGGAAPLFDPEGSLNDDVDTLYQYLFDNGGLDHMDKFAFHTAVGQSIPDIGTYVGTYTTMMGGSSAAIPMWLTETGSRDVGEDGATFSDDVDTEWEMLEELLDDAFDAGIERVYLCNFSSLYDETDLWENLEDYMGDL